MISIGELRRERSRLNNQPVKAYSSLLISVANYYIHVIPSEIDPAFVLETEVLLNDLYLAAIRSESGAFRTHELLNAVSIAGSLGFYIKHRSIGPEFFMQAKVLGRTLLNISEGLRLI